MNSLEAFCAKVAVAIGYGDLPETNDIDKNWNLLADMISNEAKGHYGLYLDNWEDLWIGLDKSEEKRIKLLGWLEELVFRGIKIMVSSREQPRKYNFKLCIYPVDPLDSGKGYDGQLFSRIYREKGGKLEPEGREYGGILKKLGGHPLSIVLAATFAAAKTSWKSVLETWIHAEMRGENERHNSLRTALGISWESLSEEPVCMDIWGILALCIDNPKVKFIAGILQCSEEKCEKELTVLYDSSIIDWGDTETVVMLPQIYYVIVKKMELDLVNEMVEGLCSGLGNYFQFNSVQSLGFLEKCLVFAKEKEQYDLVAFVLSKSGELKNRLGELDGAMELFGEAEGLYRDWGLNLGLANVLRSMGEIYKKQEVSMEIRYITQDDDIREIGRIYERSWKYAYNNIIPQSYLDSISGDDWIDGINKGGRKNIVMAENGIMIGTSCFSRSRWENYADYGEIVSLYFLPEYMGKGYGGKLLARAMEELNLLGFRKVLLWVLEDNKRARKFYEKQGFAFSGEYKAENIGGKKLREVRYEYYEN